MIILGLRGSVKIGVSPDGLYNYHSRIPVDKNCFSIAVCSLIKPFVQGIARESRRACPGLPQARVCGLSPGPSRALDAPARWTPLEAEGLHRPESFLLFRRLRANARKWYARKRVLLPPSSNRNP